MFQVIIFHKILLLYFINIIFQILFIVFSVILSIKILINNSMTKEDVIKKIITFTYVSKCVKKKFRDKTAYHECNFDSRMEMKDDVIFVFLDCTVYFWAK